MNITKKVLGITFAAAMGVVALAGCAGSERNAVNESSEAADSGKLKIVTTIFPEYDWVKNILGDMAENADITLLCDSGTDMHSYQPSVDDILKISESDIFIYTGGESDEWAESALENATNKDMISISLLDALGDKAKEEETVEGMQSEEHEHEHEEESEEEHEEEAEYDEHVWLSLENAQILTDTIAEALTKADADNADKYLSNAQEYKNALQELDAEYKETVENASIKTLLFADRFPFRYMTDDYGIDYYAAFAGCSAETEASFETVAFLSKKADELNLKHIMIIEGGNDSIAKTVISNTEAKNQDILELNSMQSVTKQSVNAGLSYISVMKDNLLILEKALN